MAKFKKVKEATAPFGNESIRTINVEQIVEIEDYSTQGNPHSRIKMSNGESFDVNKISDELVDYLNS